jgi:hypothetical protein
MVTMTLGGLWHGANWTFVAWGALHGTGLVLNHRLVGKNGVPGQALLLRGATLVFVIFAWVLFRSPQFEVAERIWAQMISLKSAGIVFAEGWDVRHLTTVSGHVWYNAFATVVAYGVGVAAIYYEESWKRVICARPWMVGALLFVSLKMMATAPLSAFLYFEF